MAARPGARAEELAGSAVGTDQVWSDREVAHLCITLGVVNAWAAKAGRRHPALAHWLRVYRAFCDVAVTRPHVDDYEDNPHRGPLKALNEEIRQAFAATPAPRKGKQGGR